MVSRVLKPNMWFYTHLGIIRFMIKYVLIVWCPKSKEEQGQTLLWKIQWLACLDLATSESLASWVEDRSNCGRHPIGTRRSLQIRRPSRLSLNFATIRRIGTLKMAKISCILVGRCLFPFLCLFWLRSDHDNVRIISTNRGSALILNSLKLVSSVKWWELRQIWTFLSRLKPTFLIEFSTSAVDTKIESEQV